MGRSHIRPYRDTNNYMFFGAILLEKAELRFTNIVRSKTRKIMPPA